MQPHSLTSAVCHITGDYDWTISWTFKLRLILIIWSSFELISVILLLPSCLFADYYINPCLCDLQVFGLVWFIKLKFVDWDYFLFRELIWCQFFVLFMQIIVLVCCFNLFLDYNQTFLVPHSSYTKKIKIQSSFWSHLPSKTILYDTPSVHNISHKTVWS